MLSAIFANMAIAPAFLQILAHPLTKRPLQYDQTTNTLTDPETSASFAIKENVPLLIMSETNNELKETGAHQRAGTSFDYKDHYQKDASTYDYFEEADSLVEREEINRLHQTILANIPGPAQWILDTGCGGGWLAKCLAPKGKNIISMDISDINPIKVVRQLPVDNHYGLVADVFELPLKAESMDCIVASEIIEHVSDPKRFLECLFGALKPGGRIIATTPYNEKIQSSLCIHCNQLTPHNAHLHSFTENSIRKLVPSNAKGSETLVFNSKLLVRSHLQKMLSFLPASIWRSLDSATISLTGKKAYRLMLTIDK